MTEQRLPPQDTDVEKAVLGALMIDTRATPVCISLLGMEPGETRDAHPPVGREHFYDRRHGTIYQAIMDIHRFEGEDIDQLILGDRLKGMGSLEEVGGIVYLAELAGGVASAANVSSHCAILTNLSTARYGIERSQALTQKLYERPESSIDVVRGWGGHLLATEGPGLDLGVTAGQMMDATQAQYEQAVMMKNKGLDYVGLNTGFNSVNFYLNGFLPNEMTTISARPTIGKTTLSGQLVIPSLRAGIRCGWFGLEMSRAQLGQMFARIESGIDAERFRKGRLNSLELQQLDSAVGRIQGWPLTTFDGDSYAVEDICALMEMTERHGHVHVWVIDYAQLIRNDGSDRELNHITTQMRRMSKRLHCHVLLLSQMSRKPEERDNHRPRVSDIRGSGGFEQDSNNIILIHKPGIYDDVVEKARKAGHNIDDLMTRTALLFVKTRNGPRGATDNETDHSGFAWEPGTARFTEAGMEHPQGGLEF